MKFPSPKPRMEVWNDSTANQAALLAQLAALEAQTKANAVALDTLDAEIEKAKEEGWQGPPQWLAHCTEHHTKKPGNTPAVRLAGDEYEYELEAAAGCYGSAPLDRFTVRARSAYALAAAVLVEAAARRCDALTVIFQRAETEAATAFKDARAQSWRPCLQAAHAHATPELSLDLMYPQPCDAGGTFFKPLRLRPALTA